MRDRAGREDTMPRADKVHAVARIGKVDMGRVVTRAGRAVKVHVENKTGIARAEMHGRWVDTAIQAGVRLVTVVLAGGKGRY